MRRAFLSLSDKTGVIEFAAKLIELGFELISTGGTETVLKEAGLPVQNVSEITLFPECLDGRVKTLHPNIHAGILAMRSNNEHMQQLERLNIKTIDLVCVNLYPFKATVANPNSTFEQAIENIDIGGPTMLRAAAKNYQDVIVIVDPSDYEPVIRELTDNGEASIDTKKCLSAKVFEHTAAYDALISQYLRTQLKQDFPEKLTLTFEKVQDLRYGENPHQRAVFYSEPLPDSSTLSKAVQLNGKELSFNNINDASGALNTLREFDETCVVAVKHANPCAIACASNVYDAYTKAYEADPVSIYGGIVATNATVDEKTASEMVKIFLEIIIAPDFTQEALNILSQKKNLRVLKLPDIMQKPTGFDMKKIPGGLLIQDFDGELFADMRVVTQLKPTQAQIEDMLFALKAVKHVKSNAIVVAKNKVTIGIGGGQVSRIWATQNAVGRSHNCQEAVMASDAYFPFDDCVREAAKVGIKCVIHPGGSVNDQLSIDACNELGISMIFCDMRHFNH